MPVLTTMLRRCSVRKYKEQAVEKEKLAQVLEAARIAPSAVNYQPWHFIVITKPAMIRKIAETYPAQWLSRAPAIIVACGDHGRSWKRRDGKDHCDIDLAIAIDHITLACVEMGLGSCWVCAFDAARCHELLGLPEQLEVIALLPIGYPDPAAPEAVKTRKNLNEIVSWEQYQPQTTE